MFSERKGKLRAYMLGAIGNYLRDLGKYRRAAKRGGGELPISLDLEMAEERYAYEPKEFDTPERLFEIRWALTLLDRVLERVGNEYARQEKSEAFEAMKGLLSGQGDVSYREIGEQIGSSEGAARVTLFRMRKLYRRFLEEEIADTLSENESVEDEILYLGRVFSQ